MTSWTSIQAVTSWCKAKEIVAQLSPNRVTRKRPAFGKLIGLIRKLTSQQQQGNLAFEQKDVAQAFFGLGEVHNGLGE